LKEEKMEVFNVVAKIKYKDNFFYVLINHACQKYFIKELDDDSIIYPTIDEFKTLNEIFSKKQAYTALKIGKNINIDPKIISRGKKLISLGLVAAALGVLGPDIVNGFNKNEPEEVVTEIKNNDERIETTYQNMGYDFHEISGYEDQRLYRIHKYVLPSYEERVTECQSFEEFAELAGTKVKPTYEEVWDTLINNPQINEKYKMWLLEGLENMQKVMPNLDLTVLKYNLNRLNIKATTNQEVNYGMENGALAGRFDPDTGIIYFSETQDETFDRFVLLHEALGHCISEASFEKPTDERYKVGNNSYWMVHITHDKVVISDSMFVMKCFDEENEEGRKFEMFRIGTGLEEGKADSIAKIAMGNVKVIGSSYSEQTEQLRIMCESLEMTLEDFIQNGGAELLSDRMQENGIENSLTYIYSNDISVTAKKSDMVELVNSKVSFKENILNYFKEYAKGKIDKGESKEEIISRFVKILSEGNGLTSALLVKDDLLVETEKIENVELPEER